MQAAGILAIVLVPFLTGAFTVKIVGFMERCFMKLSLRKKGETGEAADDFGKSEMRAPNPLSDAEDNCRFGTKNYGSDEEGRLNSISDAEDSCRGGVKSNGNSEMRGLNPVFTYISGLLTLIFLFLCVHLVGLKLDVDLKGLEKLFFVPAAVLSLLGIPALIIDAKNLRNGKTSSVKHLDAAPSDITHSSVASINATSERRNTPAAAFRKTTLLFIIPAVLLGVVSYFLFAPSYVNDDTWEVVSTTVYHGTLYEYSAMTGEAVVKGFPIFYKVYIIPMLYSCLCDFFNLPQRLLLGFLMPSILLFCNLNIIYAISKECKVKNKPVFMLLYMLLLMAGTYLPDNAIPATVGYALLREGYSGYAYAYALAIPFSVLLFIKKKHLSSVVSLAPILGLVRLDRIFYALKEPVKTYVSINTAGKLIGLYLVAVLILIIIRKLKNEKTPKPLFFLPITLIAYAGEKILTIIDGKRAKVLYLLSLSFIIFAAGNFTLYGDAELLSTELSFEESVKEELKDYSDTEIKIWASEDFMAASRRILPNIRVLYGRDDVSNMMIGLDYEDPSEHVLDFSNSYKNMHAAKDFFYESEFTTEEALSEAYKEGVDLYIP